MTQLVTPMAPYAWEWPDDDQVPKTQFTLRGLTQQEYLHIINVGRERGHPTDLMNWTHDQIMMAVAYGLTDWSLKDDFTPANVAQLPMLCLQSIGMKVIGDMLVEPKALGNSPSASPSDSSVASKDAAA